MLSGKVAGATKRDGSSTSTSLLTLARMAEWQVCLDAAAERFGVECRRIHDIFNVLESVGVLSPSTLNPKPQILNPAPCTMHPKP